MQIVHTFTRVAVTVRRWFEMGASADMEHGVRIELALLAPQEHRGTESAAQRTVVDQPFWRADIFGRLDRPDAPYGAAHYHPRFDGVEPCDREWSAELTADPFAWLADRLGHLRTCSPAPAWTPRSPSTTVGTCASRSRGSSRPPANSAPRSR